jgi:ribosomal protein S27E
LFGGEFNLFYILIICVLVVLIIIVFISAVTYRRGIPDDLKKEIAMAKQAQKMGKSPDEIRELRRRRMEKQAGVPEKKRGGLDIEADRGRATLPPMEDKLLPPADLKSKEKGGKKVKGKAVKIKCPKCDKIQLITSSQRPIEFPCGNCGMKLVLKK